MNSLEDRVDRLESVVNQNKEAGPLLHRISTLQTFLDSLISVDALIDFSLHSTHAQIPDIPATDHADRLVEHAEEVQRQAHEIQLLWHRVMALLDQHVQSVTDASLSKLIRRPE